MGMAARPVQVERVGRETGNGSYEVVGCGRWPLLVAAAKYLDAYHGRRRVAHINWARPLFSASAAGLDPLPYLPPSAVTVTAGPPNVSVTTQPNSL